MAAFDTEYKRLNPAQREAVDTVEGPVMVVAGPGTGKTQVLAMRVASILKKTQARPSNILCLTFSVAGATAMRERLRSFIGSDAYGVTVETVHGFCDGIIRKHPLVFSDFAAGKAITDLQKYRLMTSIVDAHSGSSKLINPKNPYERIPAILGRISDCKREGKSLPDLLSAADAYDTAMSEKSRKGTKAHEKNLLAARKFRDFIDLFRAYQKHLETEGLYDYDDMILVVLHALSEEDWLLQSLQERYQYFLVDEAQDLNGAQWKVIERLTTYDDLPHDPNFFLVGDDDQSIYRFQGANMEHLLGFKGRFPKAPVIVLTENYRSTQTILDAAGRLISKNEERLTGRIEGLQKNLRAHAKEKGSEPRLLRPPSDAAEPWCIADLCEERIQKGTPPEEIAVLVQTNAELFPIYEVLRARGIPVLLHGKADLLTHPVVSQTLIILRWIVSGTDDSLLHAIACACFGCHPADIARVSFLSREGKTSVKSTLLSTKIENLKDHGALEKAINKLFDLSNKHASRTVLETVEAILRECGLGGDVKSAKALDPLDLAAVEEFFRFVKQRSLDHPFLTIRQFQDELKYYDDEAFTQLRISYRMPHLVTSGVQLLTAHQSKGLEYHIVILPGFREGHWDERRSAPALSVPEDLLFGWEPEQKRFEKHQDERRVAYVAMTRAKRELLMLCPKEFSVGERLRPVAPSAFFAEAGPLPEDDIGPKNPEESSLLLLRPRRVIDEELRSYLKERLTSFALSPSSLTSFLTDPQEFCRVYLLGQPEYLDEKSLRSLGYGSAVHWALKEWAASLHEGKESNLKKFLADFEWHLAEKSVLTRKQRDDLLSQAKEDLPAYFAARLEGVVPHVYAVEREYRARFRDIPLKGKIDRIDLASPTSGDAEVIDFKTGAPKSPSQIRGGAEEGSVSRTAEGSNFRQLVFYSLLLEQAEPLLMPQSFTLEYIGGRGEDPIRRQFQISQEEKESLRKLLLNVWVKITNLDFTPLE